MPIFKLTLKLIYKILPAIAFNMIIFTGIALLIGSFYSGGSEDVVKAKVAIVSEDGDSVVISTFQDCISDIVEVIEIDTDRKSMQDALFYKRVDYILIFEKGYSDSFFTENRKSPSEMTLTDSFASAQMKNRFSLFVNTASVYYDTYKDSKTGEELIQAALENAALDIKSDTEVILIGTFRTKELFRFRTYCMFALMTLFSMIANILIIPMLAIKKGKILKRNLCAPVSSKSMNLQLLFAVSIAFICAITFYLSLGVIFFGNVVFSSQGLWMCFNALILGICYLGLCFLASVLVKSVNALNFLGTTFSLVFCFAGGAFVPQSMLSEGFLTFGKMTPAYWYVNNIETSYMSMSISGSLLTTMLGQMAIVLAFGFAALIAGLIIQKHKGQKT